MQYCDAFDSLVAHSRVLDWSHPPTTSRILQWAMISIPIVWLVYFAVPFNYVLLVSGVLGFLHKTTGVRAQRVLGAPLMAIPALGRRMSSMLDVLKGLDPMGLQTGAGAGVGGLGVGGAGIGVGAGGPSLVVGTASGGPVGGITNDAAIMGGGLGVNLMADVMRTSPLITPRQSPPPRQLPQAAPVTVSLFENQRWWAGMGCSSRKKGARMSLFPVHSDKLVHSIGPGWIPHLLSQERTPWSDAAGTVSYPPPTEYQAPQGWIWADDWRIDGEWFATDPEGWVYSDHKWMTPSPHVGLASLTRRRRWVRTMLHVPKQARGM
ncbi:hypothetical protein HDU86_000851 [Geranomyces michiganensis]|nr:hypothetical protein HDU86_000851 [Geranomyces michiganensis]